MQELQFQVRSSHSRADPLCSRRKQFQGRKLYGVIGSCNHGHQYLVMEVFR